MKYKHSDNSENFLANFFFYLGLSDEILNNLNELYNFFKKF